MQTSTNTVACPQCGSPATATTQQVRGDGVMLTQFVAFACRNNCPPPTPTQLEDLVNLPAAGPTEHADSRVDELQRQVETLQSALSGARTIGAAIGILMVSRKLPYDDAWNLLRTTSEARNRKVRDLAEALVLTGTLDD